MPSRQLTFFSFMLGISLIINRTIGISFPLVLMLPLLITVSGWKYTGYFFLINTLVTLPQTVISVGMVWDELMIFMPFIHRLIQIENIPNVSTAVKNQLTQQFILNMTKGSPVYGIVNKIFSNASNGGASHPTMESLWAIPFFAVAGVLTYFMFKGFKKVIGMYLKIYRMTKVVIHHGNLIRRNQSI